jgi:hypothetical protein
LRPELDAVILDDRVGEQLTGHLLDSGASLRLIVGLEGHDQILSRAHVADGIKTQGVQPTLDGQTRRVIDDRLQGDEHLGPIRH